MSPGTHGPGALEDVVVVLDDNIAEHELVDLRQRLHDQIAAGTRVIVIDMTAVSRIGSDALAALLGAHRACQARGGRLTLRDPGRDVTVLMHRTGLWRVFLVERTAPMPREWTTS